MIFTDDDLKRLKEQVEFETEPYMYRIHKDAMKTLLARLEAAEECIKDAEDNLGVVNPILVNVWREQSGMPDTIL